MTTASYGGSFVMVRLVAEPRLTSAWHIRGRRTSRLPRALLPSAAGKLDKELLGRWR